MKSITLWILFLQVGLCLSASIQGHMFNPFSLITSQKVISQDDYRQESYKLAMSSPEFKLCMDSSTYNLQKYSDMLGKLFKLKPGQHNQEFYASKGIPFTALGRKYLECNGNIFYYKRHIVDMTIMKYTVSYDKWNYNKKKFERKGKSMFELDMPKSSGGMFS